MELNESQKKGKQGVDMFSEKYPTIDYGVIADIYLSGMQAGIEMGRAILLGKL